VNLLIAFTIASLIVAVLHLIAWFIIGDGFDWLDDRTLRRDLPETWAWLQNERKRAGL